MIKGGFNHMSSLYEYSRLFNISINNPECIINFSYSVMPEECKGLFVYDPIDKKLLSLSPHICSIYYDPFHSVLELSYKTNNNWIDLKTQQEKEIGCSYEDWQERTRNKYVSTR